MTGKIALVRVGNECPIERHVEVAQNAGAIACVIISTPETLCQYLDQDSDAYVLTIPAICITNDDMINANFINSIFSGFSNSDQIVTVNFTVDPSPLGRLDKSGMIFMQVFFLALFSLLILFTLYKMIYFLYCERRFSLPIFIFILLIIGKSFLFFFFKFFNIIFIFFIQLKFLVKRFFMIHLFIDLKY